MFEPVFITKKGLVPASTLPSVVSSAENKKRHCGAHLEPVDMEEILKVPCPGTGRVHRAAEFGGHIN